MPAVIAIKSAERFKPAAAKFEVSCASCNLRELCLPGGLCMEDLERVENIVWPPRGKDDAGGGKVVTSPP